MDFEIDSGLSSRSDPPPYWGVDANGAMCDRGYVPHAPVSEFALVQVTLTKSGKEFLTSL